MVFKTYNLSFLEYHSLKIMCQRILVLLELRTVTNKIMEIILQ